MPTNKIAKISDVTEILDFIGRSVRARLRWSHQLRKSVSISKITDKNGLLSGKVIVGIGTDKSGNPLVGMARAFEFGSGLSATRGSRRKYKIYPSKARFLAFYWPKADVRILNASLWMGKGKRRKSGKFAGMSSDGRLLFRYVDHPGVQPRPFLQPAKEKAIRRAVPDLAYKVRNNIKNELAITIKELFPSE